MSSAVSPGPAVQLVWTPCSCCWGQRRIFVEAADGEGYVPEVCAACLGMGEVLIGA
jgi:hypothetical protein